MKKKVKTSIPIECLKKGIEQRELASFVGCTNTHLSRLLNKHNIPSVYLASKIAKYFGLQIEDFKEFNF